MRTLPAQLKGAAVPFGALLLLAFAAKSGWLAALDHAARSSLVSLEHPVLELFFRQVSFFASPPVFEAILLVWIVLALRRGQPRFATAIAFSWLLGMVLQVILRLWVGQMRPAIVLPPEPTLWQLYDLRGFTSGHTFHSALFAAWVWVALRHDPSPRARWLWAGAAALALAVGASRIVLDRHSLSDVAGGWLLTWGVMAVVLARRAWSP